mmetsp:Transcript_22289/g.68599  ORF Transcript_22289/g.68599 Transcript_22289/m.68599 type:complete len:527 (+) Transcript_22289:147-1727(+)|eukprot:CAMPEP_0198660882 /NCGR_PEP_ID=MMETSP1467-20131203/39069_1 /TAXON_ID=1462469 /ORGANISM="unid. sp., Strain CCMP2135" /LENGTH=526 /DNA_ID=CAMNT_0044397297 /DNA_START=83 /DNA_END=1663 /DNA_ORIENTATION=-
MKGAAELEVSESLRLVTLVMMWYVLAALASSASKQLLMEFKHPLSLSLSQFLCATSLCLGRAATAPSKTDNNGKCSLTASFRGLFTIARQYRCLGLQLGAGVILTSVCHRFALMLMPVSFVHTVKALQPLYTAILSWFFLGTPCPKERAAALVVVVSGVALSAYAELDYTWPGLLAAKMSVIAISTSSVLQKRYMRSEATLPFSSSTERTALENEPLLQSPSQEGKDASSPRHDGGASPRKSITKQKRERVAFAETTTSKLSPAALVSPPYASTPELAAVYDEEDGTSFAANDDERKEGDDFSSRVLEEKKKTDQYKKHEVVVVPNGGVAPVPVAGALDANSVFFLTNVFALVLLVPAWVAFDASTAVPDLAAGGSSVWLLLGMTSLAVVAQHFASISVLEAASTPVTHAVAATCKRIFVIVTSIVWFSNRIAPLNALGIALSVAGVALYDRSGRVRNKVAPVQENHRRGSSRNVAGLLSVANFPPRKHNGDGTHPDGTFSAAASPASASGLHRTHHHHRTGPGAV